MPPLIEYLSLCFIKESFCDIFSGWNHLVNETELIAKFPADYALF
jgi:hypothetical protein